MLVIAGPTGSGKSTLALSLARQLQGEVIGCDSVQIYRHFDIGSAKLTQAERQGIPHHLIDVAEPDTIFTAGDYARLARQAIAEVTARGRLPIVCGGTGFYLRALLEGLFEGPVRNEAIRARLTRRESRRPGWLHALLTRLDPPAAARIHANDTNKLIRALEVILTTRRPLTGLFAEGRDRLEGYRRVMIGLDPPRAELYARIDARCRQMFEQGLIEEARSILALGYPATCKPFESLGYAQALRVIQGTATVEEAIADTQMQTRRYAKRQGTWFRREPDIQWIHGFGESAIHPALDHIRPIVAP